MVLVMSSEHEADVATLMRVLLHPADGQSSWMRRVAAHVSALAVAPSAVVLTMRSGE